jgi:putative ABC transport system permease protein
VVSNAGMLHRLNADLRAAWRGVVAGRWSSIVAVVVLAVGTAASITAMAVAYGGLLRPLPFPEGDRLVTLTQVYVATSVKSGIKISDFDRWRDRLSTSLLLTGYSSERTTLRSAGAPGEVRAAYIVGNWFQLLGARSRFGRLIDDTSPVDEAVVGGAFAERMSPGDPAAVIGRAFTIGTRPLRVVGVLPATFKVISDADIWTLARGAGALQIVGQDDARYYQMVARVAPGRSMEFARMDAAAALPSLVPALQKDNWRVEVQPLRAAILGESRPVLLAFLAAALLVLLVACANVAMLLVNRAIARTREFAVRVALGASRTRLLTIALMETAILAGAGCLGGWWIARLATTFLQQTTGLDLPATTTLPADGPLALGAVAAGALVMLVCAAAPLVTLRRTGLASALRTTTTTTGSRGGRQIRAALVVFQLSMTVVLLTGAGLLGRTLLAVSRTDLGLDARQHVVTMAVPIGESTADAAGRLAIVRRILDETRQLPGVVAAGIGGALPPSAGGVVFTIRVSTSDGSVNATRAFDLVPVTEGYFAALGARLVTGRVFTQTDMLSSDPTCVMSEAALKHLALVTSTAIDSTLNLSLPTASGKRVKPRIVGVVRDILYSGLDAPAHGGVYVPWQQIPLRSGFLVARTTGDPAALAAPLLRIVRDADPSMPLAPARTLEDVVDVAIAPRAARFSLVGVFAIGAALLGIVGLSGGLIRSVVERQRELAIRAAVGASPRRLLVDVMRDGVLLTMIGVTLGLIVSAVLARAVSAIIFGVGPRDPLTYAVTAVAVVTVAVAACYLPARRAAASDPVVLLRAE